MKRLLIFVFLSGCFPARGQFNYFVYNARLILSTTDSTFVNEADAPGRGEVDTFSDSVTRVSSLVEYGLVHSARKRDSIRCSSILQQLSLLTNKRYTNLEHAKSSRWQTVRKQLKRSFLGSKCRFGMISVYTFTIPLVKTTGDFYYDRNGPDGGYNLYDGKRKPKASGGEEPEIIPLKPYTEEELSQLIHYKLRKTRCGSELKSGLCSYYGYTVSIDKSSLGSGRKVPQARVIVLLGSRRMKLVKPKQIR
jgi:hypothetical protein